MRIQQLFLAHLKVLVYLTDQSASLASRNGVFFGAGRRVQQQQWWAWIPLYVPHRHTQFYIIYIYIYISGYAVQCFRIILWIGPSPEGLNPVIFQMKNKKNLHKNNEHNVFFLSLIHTSLKGK